MKQGDKFLDFQPGPIFANIILADEINRATPKTQSALLEAMQEKTVTVGKQTYKLDLALCGSGDVESARTGSDLSVAGSAARPVFSSN